MPGKRTQFLIARQNFSGQMDTRREQMQTFDGVQTAAPISKCWTVLAKSCNHQQQQQQTDEIPEFAVLIKSITGSQQKVGKQKHSYYRKIGI
jgi:hypothetical protein